MGVSPVFFPVTHAGVHSANSRPSVPAAFICWIVPPTVPPPPRASFSEGRGLRIASITFPPIPSLATHSPCQKGGPFFYGFFFGLSSCAITPSPAPSSGFSVSARQVHHVRLHPAFLTRFTVPFSLAKKMGSREDSSSSIFMFRVVPYNCSPVICFRSS